MTRQRNPSPLKMRDARIFCPVCGSRKTSMMKDTASSDGFDTWDCDEPACGVTFRLSANAGQARLLRAERFRRSARKVVA